MTVSATVGRQFFRDRLTSQYASHYHLIVSIFKGVALSSAGISFLAIVASQEPTSVKATALAIWLTGVAAIIATYNGIMVVSIIVSTPPNAIDLVTPFVMGLAEFMQFAVLIPRSASVTGVERDATSQLEHLTWWPLVFAALMLSACIGISNSKGHLRKTAAAAPPDVQPLLRWYMGSLTQSQTSTAITTAVMGAAFVALHDGPSSLLHWQGVLAGIGLFGMVNGIVATERARQRMVDSVGSEAPAVDAMSDERPTAAAQPSPDN